MDDPTGIKASVHISSSGAVDPGHELFRAKDPMTMIIFGASGDLSKRMLIPALYQLQESNYLPDRYAVVGFPELK